MRLGININIDESTQRLVLTNISKLSGGAALINWIRPCENQFFVYVIYSKFKSFSSHVISKHDNLDEPLCSKCKTTLSPYYCYRLEAAK